MMIAGASLKMAAGADVPSATFQFRPSFPLPGRHPATSRHDSPFPRLTANRRSSRGLCSIQAVTTPCFRRHLLAYACVSRGGGLEPPAGPDSVLESSAASSKDASFDTKLPRRNLLVKFTCKSCGERTQRLINRLAYERGTVFVQCAGCLVNHKLIDNLGLIVDYDLRAEEETDSDTTTAQS